MADEAEYIAIERRIERFIVALGIVAAVAALIAWGWRAGAGVALGAALCWLNFNWLRQGAASLIRLGLAQAGAETVKVPKRVHAKFFGRLVLMVLAVYAILVWLRLPAVSVICGLAAVVPAIALELGYELTRGGHRLDSR
ncbi:MAG TPA: ATP synthase subunit I [Verrucomicrobiae bacterium]|nr:ATP synthase subunit I [Verrucomicrobiae bacterium]